MAYLDVLTQEVTKRFLQKVFGLMAVALCITAFTSVAIAMNQALFARIFSNSVMLIGIVVAQLGIVLALSFFINKMSAGAALFWFFVYSMLVGVTCSAILLMYTTESIVLTFFVCAATYAAVAIYAYLTDADLSSWGNLASMGLFGLIIAMLANLFFQSSSFDLVLSFIGVGIFTILTAYDVQNIKRFSPTIVQNPENEQRFAVIAALKLYLDFINLFLMLLRILGKRRD